jgi:hypothetical protein
MRRVERLDPDGNPLWIIGCLVGGEGDPYVHLYREDGLIYGHRWVTIHKNYVQLVCPNGTDPTLIDVRVNRSAI